jgi:hypothetical protein
MLMKRVPASRLVGRVPGHQRGSRSWERKKRDAGGCSDPGCNPSHLPRRGIEQSSPPRPCRFQKMAICRGGFNTISIYVLVEWFKLSLLASRSMHRAWENECCKRAPSSLPTPVSGCAAGAEESEVACQMLQEQPLGAEQDGLWKILGKLGSHGTVRTATVIQSLAPGLRPQSNVLGRGGAAVGRLPNRAIDRLCLYVLLSTAQTLEGMT